MEIIAIIPARAGSKGVPRKNIRKLCGYPLIAYSIVCALLSQTINRVIVSTDSPEIAEISKRYGAEVPFLRPEDLALDFSPDLDFVLHAMQWLEQNEGKIPEYIVHLRPTTPVRQIKTVDNAINDIIRNYSATSLRSGHVASESPYKWFVKNKEGYFKPLIEINSNDICNDPRQKFPDVFIPNGYVDILKTSYIMASGNLHGTEMIGYETPLTYEIDSEDDFEYIEYMLRKRGSEVLSYLRDKYPVEV